jgi:hypothetical protein
LNVNVTLQILIVMLEQSDTADPYMTFQRSRELQGLHKAYIPDQDCTVHSAKSHEVKRMLECMRRTNIQPGALREALQRASAAMSSTGKHAKITAANKKGLTVQVATA